MFTHRHHMSDAARADATHQAQVAEQWRDWHTFLEAQLKLLDAHQAETSHLPSFERHAASWETQREQAEAALRRIPVARRTLFERERDLRRDEMQREREHERRTQAADGRSAPVDADVIERETLLGLHAEAQGRDAAEQRGRVPMGDGRWYEVDVPALMAVPNAADYSVAEGDSWSPRRRLAMIGGLLLVLVAGMWLTWPRGTVALTADVAHLPMVDGAEARPWTVRSATLFMPLGSTTLTVTATMTEAWPPPRAAAHGAYWRAAAALPLELCVDHEQLGSATSIRLSADSTLPQRTYALRDDAGQRPDLRITACNASPGVVRYGTLAASEPAHVLALDQAGSLPGAHTLRVRTITTVGPAQDATIPEGTYRVLVVAETASTLDWSTAAPTLLLATANAVLQSDTARTPQGVELRYLVPAFNRPTEAAWMIATQGDGHDLAWRTVLQPPPSRAETLRQPLHVVRIAAHPSEAEDEVRLRIEVRNVGATPLALRSDDIEVHQDATPLALQAIAALDAPLAAGATRVLEVGVGGWQPALAATVRVGAERFRIISTNRR